MFTDEGSDHFVLASCPPGFEMQTTQSAYMQSPYLQECVPCPVSTYIIPPLDKCQKCPAGLICDGTEKVENHIENSTWVIENGAYRLLSCPLGTILVNSTIENQRCISCDVQTYSLDYEYGCHRNVCPPRACLPCPKGADCRGTTFFISKINGTEWQEVFEDGILQKRISKCPPGYTMIRNFGAADDHCKLCEIGKYNPESASSTNVTCLPCPVGAECSNGLISKIMSGYWMLDLLVIDGYEVITEMDCTIEGQTCAMLSAEPSYFLEKARREMRCIQLPRMGLTCAREMEKELSRRSETSLSATHILLCPQGACGENNMCLQNRTGKFKNFLVSSR